MNLTNQQVCAIADLMENQENEAFKAKVKAAQPTPAMLKKAKEIAKKHYNTYQSLPDFIINGVKGYGDRGTLTNFERWTINKMYPIPVQNNGKSSREATKSKIVVTAMSCKTIDELKKKLNLL